MKIVFIGAGADTEKEIRAYGQDMTEYVFKGTPLSCDVGNADHARFLANHPNFMSWDEWAAEQKIEQIKENTKKGERKKASPEVSSKAVEKKDG